MNAKALRYSFVWTVSGKDFTARVRINGSAMLNFSLEKGRVWCFGIEPCSSDVGVSELQVCDKFQTNMGWVLTDMATEAVDYPDFCKTLERWIPQPAPEITADEWVDAGGSEYRADWMVELTAPRVGWEQNGCVFRPSDDWLGGKIRLEE